MSAPASVHERGPLGCRAVAWGRLLRLSLAPSAAADVAAGIVLAGGAWSAGLGPAAVILGSLCVYHGGMALNDWADREEDTRDGRSRPLVRGEIAPSSALTLALSLLLLGPALAFSVSTASGVALVCASILAAFYDLAGRGAWRGPLLLGSCRGLNLASGAFLGSSHSAAPLVLSSIALYALYVFFVSRLARLEDAPPEDRSAARPKFLLGAASLVLLTLGCQRLLLGHPPSERSTFLPLLLAAIGSQGLVLLLRRPLSSPMEVGEAVGVALRRLLFATAALAAQAEGRDGLVVAAAILCGFPMSFGLRRLFPPT